MWFAAIGGLESIYRKIFSIMVWGVTYKSFINAVLGSLFYMKKNREKDRDYDPDDPKDAQYKGSKMPDSDKKDKKKVCNFVTDQEKDHYDKLTQELKAEDN